MKVDVNFCKPINRCKHGQHRQPLSTHVNYYSTPENSHSQHGQDIQAIDNYCRDSTNNATGGYF